MDDQTRSDVKLRLDHISSSLVGAQIHVDSGHIAAVLEVLAELKHALDGLTILLLVCHLRNRLLADDVVPPEQTVEDLRASLAQYFDIL